MQESKYSKFLSPVMVALAVAAALAALFWLGWTLLLWYRWHPHLPWRDIFVVLDDLQTLQQGSGGWRDWLFLFEPHYAAHRIALPRGLVALDLRFFHGQGHLLYTAGWLSIAVFLFAYMRLCRSYFAGQRAMWWFSGGVLGVLLFAPAHFWNLVNAINVSWHLSFALAALALMVLVRNPARPPGAGAWTLAYLLATLCAFTTFTGVVLWLLLPVMALGGRARVLLITVAVSVVFTLLYLNGISSDAAIAMAWTGEDQAIVEQIQQTGRLAADSNSPLRIFQRTAQVLCWPMSEQNSALALLVFTLSLPVLALAGGRFLWAAWAQEEPLHPWLKLCLCLAVLALGVALAIQLGRVIEQPNHAHGPSYERYNTIVAVYWAGVFGLVLGAAGSRSSTVAVAVMVGILASLYLLLKPGGTYLRQEIESLEVAARLYAEGEVPGLRGKVDKKLLRFKPEYVYSFESLFAQGELAYRYSQSIPAAPVSLSECHPDQLDFNVGDSGRPGYSSLSVVLAGTAALPVRDLILSADGELLGRLSPRHRGDFSPLALIRPGDNLWQGQVSTSAAGSSKVQVSVNSLGGGGAVCFLPRTEMNAPREPGARDRRRGPDV